MSRPPLVLSGLALVVALVALVRPSGAPPAPASGAGQAEEGELAYHMASLQRYADKLYFAGVEGNGPLADFYLHEIDETAEMIVTEAPVDDGIEIGPLVEAMMTPAVEQTEAAVASGDPAAFADAYGGLVAACNACHAASEHGFVQITVPERPAYTNQRFTPAE